ncbi:hypothetical protein NOG67_22840 (plasmid) [Erwinia persicina]|nr:hypothetical protein NOG67_22840 [Erwinia persicina]
MAVGPVAGGWLVSMFGWQSVFLLNVPLILLSFMLCLEQIPSAPPSPRPRVDYRCWILMVACLVPLLVGLCKTLGLVGFRFSGNAGDGHTVPAGFRARRAADGTTAD